MKRVAAAFLLFTLAACPESSTGPAVQPSAPGAPTIGAVTAGNASATVAFTPPADTGTASITEYVASCAAAGTQLNGSGAASPVTVTGLTNGTQYGCSVKAKNSVGLSPASASVNVTPATVPNAPSLTAVTQGVGQLSVSFTAGSNGGSAITGYTASCAPAGGSAVTASGAASPIVVTGLANATTYSCSVSATNAIGTSAASTAQSGTTASPPAAPTIGAATAGNAQLSVSFTAGSSNGSAITGYTASCAPAGGAAKTGTATSSPIVVTGLTNGTQYSCSVTATNAIGTGSASAAVSGTPATVPGAPTIGTATAGNGSLSIVFTAPASNGGSTITGYTATCTVTGGVTRTATGTASPISVTGLTNGTTYDCSVAATNALGTSAASGTVQGTPVGAPPAPTIGPATPGNQEASIAFTAPSSNGGSAITGYTVTCTATGQTTRTGTGAASPITVTSLVNGTQYSCSVKATNAAGDGTASGTVTVTPRTVPGAPTIGTVTAGNGTASVAFTAPASNGGASITGYTATCTAAGQTTRTGTGTSSPITVSSLTNDVQYACSVVATNAAGNSTASASANVTPTAPITTSAVLCSYSYDQLNAFSGLQSKVTWSCATSRTMTSTQIPDYPSDTVFSGNPNAMKVQNDPVVTFTLTPALTGVRDSSAHIVAWAKNGVKFDPATAEVCPGKSYCTGASATASATYNVEALNQTLFSAGTDNSNAHVQPNGAYHYHGMPTGYMNWISSGGTTTSGTPAVQHYLVGFAVDGFPIYAKYGYGTAMDATSAVREIKSGYRKKTTGELTAERISFGTTGKFVIGTFTQDFIYDLAGSGGDLDECNGRFAKTPEFPNGIYHYYITEQFPYIMRCLKGTVPATGRGGTGFNARAGRAIPGRPPRR